MTAAMSEPPPIDRLRAALLADEAAQLALAPLDDLGAFLDAIAAYASGLGLPLSREAFAVGLARAATPQADLALPALRTTNAPPRHWLPVELKRHQGQVVVEWLHFAGQPLSESFFEESVRRVRTLPFNRLMRCATPLSALDEFADAPPPDGLVFHMSRCGSTLVGQMLGAVPENIVLSEPPLLDTMIRLAGRGSVRPDAIAKLAGALTRSRDDRAAHRFIKLDAWHAFVLPMLRALWPETPWIFLYRDPIEVLVSQQRRGGLHVRPGVLPLDAYGVDAAQATGSYPVWILDHICNAALSQPDARRLLVNYSQLPGALMSSILPHFGIALDPAAADAIAAAGTRYSKMPGRNFVADSQAKQREASETLRRSAAPLLDTYARLEAERLAQAAMPA